MGRSTAISLKELINYEVLKTASYASLGGMSSFISLAMSQAMQQPTVRATVSTIVINSLLGAGANSLSSLVDMIPFPKGAGFGFSAFLSSFVLTAVNTVSTYLALDLTDGS